MAISKKDYYNSVNTRKIDKLANLSLKMIIRYLYILLQGVPIKMRIKYLGHPVTNLPLNDPI